MHTPPHLVVSISGHGFGHVAQTAPVLNALQQLMPKLRITVRSAVAASQLRSRIHVPFRHLTSEGDIGMMMSSALDVNVEDSRAAYWKYHADWNLQVTKEAEILRDLNANFVLSNVGYLPLAGAQRVGISNAAMCSLNWSDIYQHYCNTVRPELVEGHGIHPSTSQARMGVKSARSVDQIIAAQIQDCYAKADAFLRATPGMAMNDLPNLLPIGPIASVGTNRRDELTHRLKLSPDEKLVLISMGGIASRLPVECWPRIDGVRWLVQESWKVKHPDAIAFESLPMDFSDLLASSDALICKPGYGSFVEATCSGVPVLYVNRPDWPEAPVLNEWLKQHNVCCEVSRRALEQGKIAATLNEIWHAPLASRCVPNGALQVAEWLAEKLGGFKN
jgi:hypothetical protein